MVTYYNNFMFNEHNVCINSQLIVLDPYTMVKVAQCGENSWVYGYSYICGSSPCMRDIDVCNTRKSAIYQGLKKLLSLLNDHIKRDSYMLSKKSAIKTANLIKDKLKEMQPVQLSLF